MQKTTAMEITIDRKQINDAMKLNAIGIINKAADMAEHGFTRFEVQCPRNVGYNIWELKECVEELSNGTVRHALNSNGFAIFKIKIV